MKTKKTVTCICIITFFLFALAGCSNAQNPGIANEIHVSLEDISDVTISYDEEQVTFYPAEGDELILKEYMTKNKDNYYADVKQSGKRIHISEGGKPLFKSKFSRYVEVYLPTSYAEALTVTTTEGDIDLTNTALQLSKLRIDSTAGTVDIGSAAAFRIYLSTTSGNITCDKLAGNVEYTSTSGNADIKSAVGCGSYKANNSGKLNVNYAEVTGDLYVFNKNENIRLTLPDNLSFEFEAITKNGSVSTTFQECIRFDGRTAHGTVGDNPTVTVKTETRNGTIEVTK